MAIKTLPFLQEQPGEMIMMREVLLRVSASTQNAHYIKIMMLHCPHAATGRTWNRFSHPSPLADANELIDGAQHALLSWLQLGEKLGFNSYWHGCGTANQKTFFQIPYCRLSNISNISSDAGDVGSCNLKNTWGFALAIHGGAFYL